MVLTEFSLSGLKLIDCSSNSMLLRNPKLHHPVHKSPLILGQHNPDHILKSYLLTTLEYSSPHLHLSNPSDFFLWWFTINKR